MSGRPSIHTRSSEGSESNSFDYGPYYHELQNTAHMRSISKGTAPGYHLPSSAAQPPPFAQLLNAALAMHHALMTYRAGAINHVFTGRFSMMLRGSSRAARWVDVEVSLPEVNGMALLPEVFHANSPFTCPTFGYPFCMVLHNKTGVHFRLSINRIRSLAKKSLLIGVAAHHIPCLSPGAQFLDLLQSCGSSSSNSSPPLSSSPPNHSHHPTTSSSQSSDAEDLVWMYRNLNVDVRAVTDSESKLGKMINWRKTVARALERYPFLQEPLKELGFVW